MSKKLVSAVVAATLGAAALSTPVMAEVTATAGLVSDYYFRGANLGDGGANASIDWANDSGVSVGAWAIDDQDGGNDGLEVDLYASYGHDFNDDVSASIGLARYEYTGMRSNFETEVNLGISFQDYSLAVDVGESDPNDEAGTDATDYLHVAASWSGEVYGVTVGQGDPDTDADDDEYQYAEVSASGEVSGLDMSISAGKTTNDVLYDTDGGYIVLSASKTFDL